MRTSAARRSKRLLAVALLATASVAALAAQVSSPVENLGSIPAGQLVDGMGFNVSPLNDWEFKAAAEAGAKTVRFQCGWENIETQTLPPANQNRNPRFALTSACAQGLASSRRYALRPTVLAAYGPPYRELLQFTVPGGAAAGARTIDIQLRSAAAGVTLQHIRPFYATVLAQDRSYLTKTHGYAGGLVVEVAAIDAFRVRLSLASGLVNALPASSTASYLLNEYLYPPPATFLPTDPSNLAFAEYARFLATSIQAAGITGEVEIWNEPPWDDDPWDQRYRYYDDLTGAPTGPDQARLANYGFAAILQGDAYAVPGVTYVWGGTHKTGATSLFDWMYSATGVQPRQPATVITTEAWHPYGNTPEDGLWSQPCMKATVAANPNNPYPGFFQCNLFGLGGGNSSLGEWYNLRQKLANPAWGIKREITETGIPAAFADAAHRSRYLLRQFLGYQAAGVTPIQFYRLYDTGDYDFSFVRPPSSDSSAALPLPQLQVLTSLLQDAKGLGASPAAPSVTQPAVKQYAGSLPLTTVAIEGRRQGDDTNSQLFTLWQRSSSANWASAPPPPAAAVTLTLPAGRSTTRVVNLATRTEVGFTVAGQDVSFLVADDPIGVFVTATSSTTLRPPSGVRVTTGAR